MIAGIEVEELKLIPFDEVTTHPFLSQKIVEHLQTLCYIIKLSLCLLKKFIRHLSPLKVSP